MIYKNSDEKAITAMECVRTGHYGEDDSSSLYCCPVCGEMNFSCLYKNNLTEKIVGCNYCVSTEYIN